MTYQPGVTYQLGIDLGTTHTVAALGRPDGRVQSLLFAASPLLSSAVYADRDGRLVTGQDALRSARLDPTRFEPNIKRRIDDQTVLLGDRAYPVVELVAAVLARVRDEAVRVAGGPPARTVLTYPAGWGATRRAVLAQAAEQAGLGTVELVPEPLAAALYFAGEHPGDALVVYDFGAGTFDVSVIGRRPDGGWQVLASDGLADVGGLDLDEAIVAHLRIGPLRPESRWQLLDEVRAAKEQLSRTSTAVIRVPDTGTDVHLTREEFERLARPWLDRTVALTADTVRRAGLPGRVPTVLLVGGSSRIPLVATLLHQRLGIAPTVLDQPELVVAEGSLRALPPAPPAAPVEMGPVEIGPDEGRQAGRRTWPKVLVAAVLVLAVALLGTFAISKLINHPKPTGQSGTNRITADKLKTTSPPTEPSPELSTEPSREPSTEAATYTVVYRVTASGSHNTGSVSYTDGDGDTIRRSGIPLPWEFTFTTDQRQPVVLITQRKSGGDAGPVTCSITVNGKTISTTTNTGRSAAPECSGSTA